MLEKTRAIVLNSLKYGESQIIVDLFTATRGRLSFLQRVARQGRSAARKHLFQPLTVLDVEFDYRANRRLHKLRDVSTAFPFRSLPFDMAKLSIALFVAEFTAYATRSEQADPALYAFIENSVRWLDACENGFANFHIIYMLHLTRFMGFYPNINDDCHGGFFDMRGGCFVDSQPLHPDFLAPDEAGKIRLLLRLNYSTMRLLHLSRDERNRCIDVVLAYYRLHQPAFPEMKSLAVLRELFDGK